MAITKTSLDDAAKTINSTVTIAKTIKKTMGRSSLARMAKDSVMQFPLIISSSIDTDDIVIMSRAIEKQYAALMVSVLSMNNGVNINKYGSVADYLKKFHSNKDIPSNIRAATDFILESAKNIDITDPLISQIAMECWDIVEEQLDNELLNDIYRPYDRTLRILQEKIGSLKTANEASLKQTVNDMANKIKQSNTGDSYGGPNPTSTRNISGYTNSVTTIDKIKDGSTGENTEKSHTVITNNPPRTETTKGAPIYSNFKPGIVRNDSLSNLEPTLIEMQFLCHGGEGNNTQWTANVVIGIKNMIRLVRSELMVANMSEAAKNSNKIFKFIKWTKGELKFIKDFVFNVSEIKDIALADSKKTSRWWKALRRRKAINNVTKFFDNKVLPNTTIIISRYEAERIAELTGVDLSEPHNAMKLLSEYYLLGFGIYDTEIKTLSMMFDGDIDFAQSTISALNSANKKETELTDARKMLTLMGRV